jgi:hypothetical protein
MLVLLQVSAHPAQAQDGLARIVHTPVTFANQGRPISIEAYTEGDGNLGVLSEARIWYRPRDGQTYTYEEMLRSGTNWYGEIPADEVVNEGVEYYLEFIYEGGPEGTSSLTYPPTGGTGGIPGNPVEVSVRGAGAGTIGEDSPLVIISPEPFTRVQGEVLIAVAFNQSIRLIAPDKIRVKLNNRDVTQRLNITEELAIGTLSGIKPGRTRVDIDYLGEDGRESLGNFSFTFLPGAAPSRESRHQFSGDVSSEGRFQRLNDDARRIAIQRANLRYRYRGFSVIGNTLLSSEEHATLQPQHRFTLDMGFRGFRIRAGDIKPRYNELILWGRRVRGGELYAGGSFMGVSVIYGQTSRAVDGTIYYTSDEDPDNPGVMLTDTTTVYGTYQRDLAAARLRFGNPDKVSLGLTAMKVRDDTASIDFGDAPKDNLVTGLDFSAYFDRRRFSLKGEVALSATSDDIRDAPFEDMADFTDILVVNQHFDPLPDEGIEESETDSTQTELKVDEVAKSIISNSLSYKGRLRMRYLRNDLQVGYRLINRGYRTLANTSLVNNQAGYYVRDRIRLIGNNVYLNGGFEVYTDNVSGKGAYTNERQKVNAGLSIYTGRSLPDIAFGYSEFLNSNDATIDTTVLVEPDPVSGTPGEYKITDNRSENTTSSYNASLSQQLEFLSARHNLTLSLLNSDRDDAYQDIASATQSVMSLSMRSRYDLPLMSTVNFSNSSYTSLGGLTNLTFNVFSVRADVFMMDRKLIPWFGPRMSLRSGKQAINYSDPALELDPSQADYEERLAELYDQRERTLHVDVTKLEWLGGFRWNITQNQVLDGSFSISQYLENSEYEYWDGDRVSVEEAGGINRDDLIAVLQYQIRF